MTTITIDNTSSPRVLIAFFGVVSRSIEYTYKNLKNNLINIIKSKYELDIYVFNNDVQRAEVDGIKQNNDITHLLEYTVKEEKTQRKIDSIIQNKIESDNINNIKMVHFYTNSMITNTFRQMYSEEQIGKYIEKHKDKYDCVIVCGPDYYLLKPINLNHVENIINKKKDVYTTIVNEGRGYTNGFYIGQPTMMVHILKRFSLINSLFPTNKDYEYFLKCAFLRHNINRSITNMLFLKIRSNKETAIQGILKKSIYKKFTNVDDLDKFCNTI